MPAGTPLPLLWINNVRPFADGANTPASAPAEPCVDGPTHMVIPPLRCGMTRLIGLSLILFRFYVRRRDKAVVTGRERVELRRCKDSDGPVLEEDEKLPCDQIYLEKLSGVRHGNLFCLTCDRPEAVSST